MPVSIEQLKFTIPEILSLLGVAQCLYVLVYMTFHAGAWRQALVPFAYFTVIAIAFFLDFAQRFIAEIIPAYAVWQLIEWFLSIPLAVLLIIQILQVGHLPSGRTLWILPLMLAAFGAAWGLGALDSGCEGGRADCTVYHDWIIVLGVAAGSLSMAVLLRHQSELLGLKSGAHQKQQRYWLVLALVFSCLAFLFFMLVSITPLMGNVENADMVRTFIGLAFVYLAGTSLFRIYPQAVVTVATRGKNETQDLSADEAALARRIEALIENEKIYHEPSYTRSDLARELEISETQLSKIINIHFGKSFPQLLNEKRIADSRHFLEKTDASIRKIALECGFNSVSSFNRVFRQVSGQTPGEYRNRLKTVDNK